MGRRIHGVDVGILPKAADEEGEQLRTKACFHNRLLKN